MKRRVAQALGDEQGSSTVEFVVVFFAFISMMMFVIEVAIYQYYVASLEKAAEAGVRYAIVSAPAARNVSLQNGLDGDDWGEACAPVGGSCNTFSTRECRGSFMSTCRAAQLDEIVAAMRRYNGSIQRRNVTVTYQNTGIGFAGGPTAPLVTVSISGVRVSTGILGMLIGSDANGLRTLPRRAASMTGEDMAS
jgi:Flp pilus assembly protein TadG